MYWHPISILTKILAILIIILILHDVLNTKLTSINTTRKIIITESFYFDFVLETLGIVIGNGIGDQSSNPG